MADLIRTLESDLFGGYEWAAEFYEDLRDVPEAPDRLAVFRGLLRAYDALDDKADEAMRAADGLVRAEDELDETERALLAPLEGPRDALFDDLSGDAARAFLDAFNKAWAQGPKSALLSDAVLAALTKSNVLASLERKQLDDEERRRLHAEAAALYEEINAMLQFRLGTGSTLWGETAQSALFRAAAAWRMGGREDRATRAHEIAGVPEGAAGLEGRGLRR